MSHAANTIRDIAKLLHRAADKLDFAIAKVAGCAGESMVCRESTADADKRLRRANRHANKTRRGILGLLLQAKNIVCNKNKPKRRPFCPICGTFFSTWTAVVRHGSKGHGWAKVMPRHMGPSGPMCPCGFLGTPRRIALHLAGQADVALHVKLGVVAGNGKAVQP